jgi:hypothetical protein
MGRLIFQCTRAAEPWLGCHVFLLNNGSQVDPRRLPFRAENLKTIVHAAKVERVGLVAVFVLEILICCLGKKEVEI